MTDKGSLAWLETLPRYTYWQIGNSMPANSVFLDLADVLAACPPPPHNEDEGTPALQACPACLDTGEPEPSHPSLACGNCGRLWMLTKTNTTHYPPGIPKRAAAPAPELLAKAVNDRDAHPWRYYRFERDDLIKWLDKLAATLAARDAALQACERLADDRWLTIQRLTSQHNDWKAQAERAEVALRACQKERDEARSALELQLRGLQVERNILERERNDYRCRVENQRETIQKLRGGDSMNLDDPTATARERLFTIRRLVQQMLEELEMMPPGFQPTPDDYVRQEQLIRKLQDELKEKT